MYTIIDNDGKEVGSFSLDEIKALKEAVYHAEPFFFDSMEGEESDGERLYYKVYNKIIDLLPDKKNVN